jgi:hypothetical protein
MMAEGNPLLVILSASMGAWLAYGGFVESRSGIASWQWMRGWQRQFYPKDKCKRTFVAITVTKLSIGAFLIILALTSVYSP